MKQYKEIIIPAKPAVDSRIENVFDKLVCDICGNEIGDKQLDVFEINEVNVSHKTGTNYPECGSGDRISFDICPECFTNKLTPWLIENGCTPVKDEWDW